MPLGRLAMPLGRLAVPSELPLSEVVHCEAALPKWLKKKKGREAQEKRPALPVHRQHSQMVLTKMNEMSEP